MARFALALLLALAFAVNPIATASAKAHCHLVKPMAAASHQAPMKGDPCCGDADMASCAQACATFCATMTALPPLDFVPAVVLVNQQGAPPRASLPRGPPPGAIDHPPKLFA